MIKLEYTMKKISLFLLVVITTFIVSCSNSDIEILKPAVVKVNLSSIMKPFNFQINAGDLDGVSEAYQIRITLLAYDSEGNLFDKQESYASNFLSTVSFNLNLKDDVYRIVALSDQVSSKSGIIPEYWAIAGEDKLSTLVVNYLCKDQYCYGKQEILALGTTSMYPGSDTTIDMKAAGALICTWFSNIHEYSNVYSMVSFTNRNNDSYSFSSDGSFVVNQDLNTEGICLRLQDIPNKYQKVSGQYSYKFLMPLKNVKYSVLLLDKDNNQLSSSYVTLDLKSNREYVAFVELNNELANGWVFEFEDVTDWSTRSTKGLSKDLHVDMVNDVWNTLPSFDLQNCQESTSYKVVDLLK